ncbi:MAG: PEP-CTERM sorting domain-containing protein [Opitutales bacterium]|nr:PEP-CTERM sorting domain-containing protein [Opitutales bacterium]
MKKYITLAALLAAGTACANAAQTVVFDFGRTDADSYKTPGAICIGTGSSPYEGGISASGNLEIFSGSYSFTQEASGGGWYNNSATLTTDEEASWKNHLTEMPSGWGNTFADGLTCQWNGSSGNTFTLVFSNLESGYYDLSVLGGYCGQDNLSSTIKLTLGGATTTETEWTLVDIGGNAAATTQSGVSELTSSLTNTADANEGYTFDITKIFVGESGSLTVTIDGAGAGDQRTPLNGLKLTFIPEPSAFGMLAGLGALALVASRRRRK